MHRTKLSNVTCSLVAFTLFSLTSITAGDAPDVSRWKTFTNRAGWQIKYPGSWQVGSCRQCSDPTDPNGFVTFYNRSTNESIMIERLIDKPPDQTVEQWLNDVKVTTVLNPVVK